MNAPNHSLPAKKAIKQRITPKRNIRPTSQRPLFSKLQRTKQPPLFTATQRCFAGAKDDKGTTQKKRKHNPWLDDPLYEWDPEKYSYFERLKFIELKPAENDVIGIKIGDTNLNMALVEHGSAVPILTRDNLTSQIPTAVSIGVDGIVLLGKQAMERQLLNPSGVVYDFMKFVGVKEMTPEIMSKDQQLLPYKLVPHQDQVGVEIWDTKYSFGQLMDFLLKKTKWIAERQLLRQLEQCVLTVPPSWSEEQREEYRKIVSTSGWKVNDIITEPIAIAFAYGKKRKKGQKVAVYDLGGTSFTFSLLETIEDDITTIKTSKSTRFIGGVDFDNILLDHLVVQCANDLGIDFRQDELVMHRLKEASKTAKEHLSSYPFAEIDIPFIYADQLGPKHFKTTITADYYNEIAFPYLWRTLRFVNQAFEEAEWDIYDIDQVILAGGMAKWPMIKQLLDRYFGGSKKIFDYISTDEVTAIGAAQYGEVQRRVFVGNPPNMNPLGLGFSVAGGAFVELIQRGVFFPTKKSTIVRTTEDYQTSFQLDIFQGERKVVSRNKYIGSMVIENLDPMPAGTVKLGIDFELDKTGVLNVSVKDLYTKHRVSDTFGCVHAHGMTKEEIQKEVILAEIHQDDDKHAIHLIELHHKAQAIYESLLEDAKRVAGTVPPNLVKPFYESMQQLRRCIEMPDGLTEKDYKRAIATAQRHYAQFEEFWFFSQANQDAVDLRNRWETQHAAFNPHMTIRHVDESKTKLERLPPNRLRQNENQGFKLKLSNVTPDLSWWERVYQMPMFFGFLTEQQKFLRKLVEEGRYRATGKGGVRNDQEAEEQLRATERLEYGKDNTIVKRSSQMDIMGEYFSNDYIKFDRFSIVTPQFMWIRDKQPPNFLAPLANTLDDPEPVELDVFARQSPRRTPEGRIKAEQESKLDSDDDELLEATTAKSKPKKDQKDGDDGDGVNEVGKGNGKDDQTEEFETPKERRDEAEMWEALARDAEKQREEEHEFRENLAKLKEGKLDEETAAAVQRKLRRNQILKQVKEQRDQQFQQEYNAAQQRPGKTRGTRKSEQHRW